MEPDCRNDVFLERGPRMSEDSTRILDTTFLQNKTCLEKFLVIVTVSLLVAVVLLAIVLALLVGGQPSRKQDVCLTPDCIDISARVYGSMDWGTDPCENFYTYACGAWIDRNVIPEDESTYAIFPTTLRKERNILLKRKFSMLPISIPKEDRRDIEKTYNKMTIEQLGKNFTGIDWLPFLQAVLRNFELDTDQSEDTIVRAPAYIRKLFPVLSRYPVRAVANYVVWRVLLDSIKALPLEFQELLTQYNRIVLGTRVSKPRWKTCVEYLISSMPLAVGRQFVQRAFDKEAKSLAVDMITNIQNQFITAVDSVIWMDDQTKQLAKEKAQAIIEKIGYPEEIHNATHLDLLYKNITIKEGTFLRTALATTIQEVTTSFKKLRKPVDKLIWDFSPAMINAFYYSIYNQMIFLAGILQPPFFSRHQPVSMNYGGIGVVIGHEITHGFDDKGRQYDKDGYLRQWWSDEAIKSFRKKTQCMIKQYDNYTLPELNMTINGARTLGENIADNGGLKMSFQAYQKWLSQNGGTDTILPGLNLTHNQLFFVNFAQLWCALTRKEHLINALISDSHSPGKVRTIVTLRNSKEFSKVFQCKVGSKMNPIRKCSIY
ncbi:hypothetical protein ScPMuIL_008837 [Solemya velum]